MLVLLGRRVRAHHAGQRVAVGDADGGQPQLRRLPDHLLRMRGPAQEREVGGGHQLGEGGHTPRDVIPGLVPGIQPSAGAIEQIAQAIAAWS